MSLPIEGRCFLAQTAHKFSFMDWWLPPNYSEHGGQIDYLFYWIFGITVAALVIVQAVLVWFLIKYRRRPGVKSHFIHGNTKLEMAWTLTPAVILAVLALASKVSWHNYRYNPDPDKVQVMVVGEQFKWNVIYAGPDNKVGTYMRFPHLSDPEHRGRDSKGARKAINDVMQSKNPLGQVKPTPRPADASASWTDPVADDETENALGKPLIIPVNRTVDIVLSSKDVLHDFAIPNFRAMLDAVPGMIGHIYFKPKRQSTVLEKVEEIPLSKPLWIDRDTPTAVGDRDSEFSPTRDRSFKLFDPGSDERLAKIINETFAEIAARDDKALADKLKAANITAESVIRRLGDEPLRQARAGGLKPLLDAETARLAADAADVKPLKEAGLEEVIAAAAGRVGSIGNRDTLRDLVRARVGESATPEQYEAEGKKLVEDLKRANVHHLTTITAFEVVCRELCGMGHGTMRAELIVVSDQEYDNFIYRNAPLEKRTGRKFHDPAKRGPQIAGAEAPPVLAGRDAAPASASR